jgi:hypothetical protein
MLHRAEAHTIAQRPRATRVAPAPPVGARVGRLASAGLPPSTQWRRCAHLEPMSHGPAHHDGGSLAGKDCLFDSSTGSRTGSGCAGLLIGRPSASSSLVATVRGGRDARSAFMSQRMARRGAWRTSRAQIDWSGVLARATAAAPSVDTRCCPGHLTRRAFALRRRPGALRHEHDRAPGHADEAQSTSSRRAGRAAARDPASFRAAATWCLASGQTERHGALWSAGSVDASRPGRA